MRRGHFATLAPVCPVCRRNAPLTIGSSIREEGDDILEGILTCSNAECRREYPIIDGIPIVVGAIRGWLAANPLAVLQRDDLSAEIESLVGDALGPGSAFDTNRQHCGTYAESHYVDPPRLLDVVGQAILPVPEGPAIDIGCAVGGTTFAIAERTGRMTVGVDLNFAMLRVASRALRTGRVVYAQRRVGLVYDRREIAIDSAARPLVDFWCCDAAALPFADQTFALAASLNLIDCVMAPRDAIAEMGRITCNGGTVVIATPYDWSTAATPIEQWLGGHSQRSEQHGASEPILRALLGGDHPAAIDGFRIVAEEERVPWRVRLHDRSAVEYAVHVIVARRE